MTALFSSPKTPKVPDPPAPTAPPATSDAAQTADAAAERLRKRRGTAATVLAGDAAPVGAASVATKTLLGQ